jgi:PBP1b-binding outer membrane lipoprotein LpoB
MSKSFITVSLLIILASACSRPLAATTPSAEIQFAQPMATATPTALFNTIDAVSTHTPSVVTATAASSCSAPAPHVQIGQKVTVTVENWDKLKLRSKPEISSDTMILDLEQYSRLEILEGPECVSSAEAGDSYWFWKVKVLPSGEIGWVAEGDASHYYIENAHG